MDKATERRLQALVKRGPSTLKIGDRVNAIDCAEAGHPDFVNMEIVSEVWVLGHGEEVVQVRRPSGKRDTRATRQLTPSEVRP